MDYTVNGKRYTVNVGFLFKSKKSGLTSTTIVLRKPEMLDNYDVIPEPVVEEQEEQEE